MQQKEEETQKYIRIPFLDTLKIESPPQNLSIIGLIDASGSMEICWEWLANFWNKSIPKENLKTITFSNQPKMRNNTNLEPQDIMVHGGQGTEIVPAFEKLEQELDKIPIENNITVIFISDGDDNKTKTLEDRMQQKLKGNPLNKKINFICLGVESGFPTSLAIHLRQLYHRGDPQIPAVYLIEYASEQAFFNKFEQMKAYFYPSRVLQLSSYANLYPYDETITNYVYEGQWVFTNQNSLDLIIPKYGKLPLQAKSEKELDATDIMDIFRSWVQNLQIQSFSAKQDNKEKAQVLLEVMQRMVLHLSQSLQVDIMNINQQDLNNHLKPFYQRAKESFVFKYCNKIYFFVNEVQSLAKGVNPNQLNEFEQAKRLMIGTITGKHHQKALALKGITVEEFQVMKQEFAEIIQNCKFNPENEKGQERSVITLENQRDTINNPKVILETLKYINSQYDFAETFPLIGHGIKVKRLEGSQVNPWIVVVEKFAKQNKVIDSGYLIKNNFIVSLGVGGDDKEAINCILPLYNESDIDLQPFLRSRIIKLLMTFMVQQNVDTLYEETYLALLANALVNVTQQKPSEWREEIINLIYQTTKIVYQGTQSFENYLIKLSKNPFKAYFESEQAYETHIAMAKPFIYTFYGLQVGWIKDIETHIERLLVYYFSRQFKKQPKLKNTCIVTSLSQENKDQILNEAIKEFPHHFYLASFKTKIDTLIKSSANIVLDKDNIQFSVSDSLMINDDTIFNTACVESIYERFTGKKFEQRRYIHLVFHAMEYSDAHIMTTKVSYDNMEQIRLKAKQNMSQLDFLRDLMETEYKNQFVKAHIIVPSLTEQELKSEQARLGLNGQIDYSPLTGLSKNCCFAKDCAFYLKPMNGDLFRKHLNNWQGCIPDRFHSFLIKQLSEKSTPQQIIERAKAKWVGFPEKYLGTEETVQKYIEVTQQFINKNKQN